MFAKNLTQQGSDCITPALIINIVNNESRKKLFTGCCVRKAKLAMAAFKSVEIGTRNFVCRAVLRKDCS